jgi:YHS domain-containing protein
MPGDTGLSQRIKAEFDKSAERAKAAEKSRADESKQHEQRLAQFSKVCDELKAVWRPRFEEFAKQFGDKIKVTPTVSPSMREAEMNFLTELANITLKISVSPSPDLTKLVLDYDLLILPVFFEYQRHARLELPLDRVDRDAVGKWIDDQLVSCVKTYLSLQENDHYLRRAMVEDPISKKRFMPQEAAAKLEHRGNTVYFSSQDSLVEYKKKHQITA